MRTRSDLLERDELLSRFPCCTGRARASRRRSRSATPRSPRASGDWSTRP